MVKNSLLSWTNQHTSIDTGEPEERIFMETGLWTARSGFEVPVGARDFSFLQNVQTGSGAHSGPFSISTLARPEREADKALQSSGEVKNKWSYAATSYTPPWRKKGKFELFLPPAWLRYVMVLMELVKFPTPTFKKWKCYLSQRTAVYITQYTVYKKTHWRPRGYRLLHRSNAVPMVILLSRTHKVGSSVFVSVQTIA